MDCKIIPRLFFLIIFFISAHSNAIEFKGKFLQGHYIIGITDPSSKIIIDKKEVLDNIPLGKFAELSDVASAAVFLASDAASMITGTSLLVDGGWTAK